MRTRLDVTLYVKCPSCCPSDDAGMKMKLTVEWEILCSHSDISVVEGVGMYNTVLTDMHCYKYGEWWNESKTAKLKYLEK
jgi:hypothetical protein